ncbi:D-alanine--D-alanine ligase [Inquilinus sp. Marseille-Q2685]|uniref:D-alanine--D-alanine ligase n=1 Tax=Inquilinus sp. Marseille-Q2685 TaxID=2866581 RepID=UPI001CE46865|nr:D-alanine--D-alanine ligase [Inquilinus sp. Marseille-Q2685]
MTKSVAVLYGGWSAEREVSLVSGKAVAVALRGRGHRVELIDVGRDLDALLRALRPAPDVVFNALHGKGGEDGTIQGVLDMLGLPYTHSGVRPSAIAMSKPATKQVVGAVGIRTARGVVAPPEQVAERHLMEPPYVVKPAAEGSSVGVRIVRANDNVPPIDLAAWGYGDALVEEYVPGRELTVGVMGDRALTVTEIAHTHAFFDYDAKYTEGHAVHTLPAQVPDDVSAEAMRLALLAHRTLGCRGISRTDFRWDDTRPGTEGLYFLEINTQPGFTPISLVPEQARHVGVDFADLCEWLLEDAACAR